MRILRQSALGTYEQCAHLFREQYGEYDGVDSYQNDDPRWQNKYTQTGIKFHEVMEHWGNTKIGGGKMSRQELHDFLDERLLDIEHAHFDNEIDRDAFHESLHKQIDWVYPEFKGRVPLIVEHKFEDVELFDGMPSFSGTIDWVEGDVDSRKVAMQDWKTGKTYTRNELKSNMQACIYAQYWYVTHGFYPEEFTYVFTKHEKTKTIKITPEFMEKGEERIRNAWMHILNKDFNPPINRNKFFCSNFCSSCTCRHKSAWGNVGFELFIPARNVIKERGE